MPALCYRKCQKPLCRARSLRGPARHSQKRARPQPHDGGYGPSHTGPLTATARRSAVKPCTARAMLHASEVITLRCFARLADKYPGRRASSRANVTALAKRSVELVPEDSATDTA